MGRALGEFEQIILFALIELGDDAYGAAVGRAIEARTGRDVSAGAVYTALDRLEARGLVTSRVGEPTAERGGRRKKHYRLEPSGAAELRRSVDLMRAMSEGLLPRLDDLVAGGGGS
jgi:DNA-binding PadR family transcriptional regulator